MNKGEERLCDYFADRSGSFFEALFKAMFAADGKNLAKLSISFPDEAQAVDRYQHEDGYWQALEIEYNGPRNAP